MIWSILGWVWTAIAALLFVMGVAGFINPRWMRDPKTGEVPGRLKMLLIAWFGPALFGAFAFAFFGLAGDAAADNDASTRTQQSGTWRQISAAELGDDWPFVPERADVRCERGLLPVVRLDGVEYGLTGAARGMGYRQLSPSDAVWADGEHPGIKKSLMPVQQLARQLC